ncbi:MAG TPA: SGNH hydrolase domain-containing protein [Acidimicrobiales bacterium]|nr:SGNH hydrolase domain-containing protein [Acidimicrobiales bacterium]
MSGVRALSVACALVLSAALLGATGTASAQVTAPRPTLHQLEHDVAASVRVATAPNPAATVPPLTSLNGSDASISPVRRACYSQGGSTTVPANAATLCAYGATTATRTILLAGDSQAGMWLPAMDAVGRALGWRVVILAKEGCSPWASVTPPSAMIAPGLTAGACATFNEHVASWAARARPAVVLLDGRSFERLGPLESQMNYAAGLFTPSHATLLVLGPIPEYALPATSVTPTDCLDGAAPYTRCRLSPRRLLPATEVAAEAHAARAGWFRVVAVTPLLCTARSCAVAVRDAAGRSHLVYYDATHVNRFFASWVSVALSSVLAPFLPGR